MADKMNTPKDEDHADECPCSPNFFVMESDEEPVCACDDLADYMEQRQLDMREDR